MTSDEGAGPFTIELLDKAWELRQRGIYTMREIADQLGVERVALIEALKRRLVEGQP